MNIVIDYDDFHWRQPENCLVTLYTFIKLIPNIKINLFASPNYMYQPLYSDRNWCDQVKELINSDNVRLCVHGFYHSMEEFKYKNYDEAIETIERSEDYFNQANLSYLKVFKGPYWGINENTYNALIKLNYTHIYTHDDYNLLIDKFDKIKSIIYNWNLKDKEPPNDDIIIAHGHVHPVCGNGIDETKEQLLNFIEKYNPKFKFADEI